MAFTKQILSVYLEPLLFTHLLYCFSLWFNSIILKYTENSYSCLSIPIVVFYCLHLLEGKVEMFKLILNILKGYYDIYNILLMKIN